MNTGTGMSQRHAFSEIDALAFGGEDGNVPTEQEALLDESTSDPDVTGESSASQGNAPAPPRASNARESIYVCMVEGILTLCSST